MKTERNKTKKMLMFTSLLSIGIVGLVVAFILEIVTGAGGFKIEDALQVLFNYDSNSPQQVLLFEMRIPRAVVAGLVGASLAVSGALMQGVTHNPMADSGLMGLSSGAVFMVALSYTVFRGVGYYTTVLMAFVGAAFGALVIYAISYMTPGKNQPMKLVLAGAAMTALFSALSQGLTIANNVAQNVSFWTMGSVANASWLYVKVGLITTIPAFILALLISKSVTLMSMGEEVARALGVRINLVRILTVMIVIVLAGVSVALAGLISFVGIIVPHILRRFVGLNYSFLMALSMVYGAVLMMLADVLSKWVIAPGEVPIGALIALIGVPVFLIISRESGGVKHVR